MMVKAKSGIENPEAATQRDAGDLYFVNPKGEFIASYGPDASPKAIAAEWSEMMKVRCAQKDLCSTSRAVAKASEKSIQMQRIHTFDLAWKAVWQASGNYFQVRQRSARPLS